MPVNPVELANANAAYRSAQFASKFNELMQGKKTSTPVSVSQLASYPQNAASAAKFINDLKKTATIKKATTVKAPKAAVDPNYKTNNFQNLVDGKQVGVGADVDGPSLLDSIESFDKDYGPWTGIKKILGSDIVQKPLDIVSRPAYAVNNYLKNAVEQTVQQDKQKGLDKPSFQDLLDNVLSGTGGGGSKIVAGLTGRDKASGFDVANAFELANRPDKAPSTGVLKTFEGLGTSVLTDPLTYASVGTEAIARGAATSVGKKGIEELVTEEIPKILHGSPAENIVKRSITSTGMLGKNIPLADYIADTIAKNSDQILTEIAGGMKQGTVLGVDEGIKDAVQGITIHSFNGMVDDLHSTATSYLRSADPTLPGRPWSAPKLAAERANNPLFGEWYDQAQHLNPSDPQWAAKSQDIMKEVASGYAADIHAKAVEALTNKAFNVPTLKLLGHEVASFDRLGEAFNDFKKTKIPLLGKSLEEAWGKGIGKAFSYNSNFPGTTFLLESRARTLGVKAFERSEAQMAQAFKDISATDSALIHSSVGKGTSLTGNSALAKDALEKGYADIRANEIGLGIDHPYSPNYTYTHLKGNVTEAQYKAFEDAQNAIIKSGGSWDGIEQAKRLGLKPETDAFKNYRYRLAMSNREQTTSRYLQDLATQWGKISSMSKEEAAKLGMVPLTSQRYLQLPSTLLKPGETLYLDKDIHDTIKALTNLTSAGMPAEEGMNQAIKALDYMTKKFKTWNTVYYPGYHIKNFLSDMYIGALDGVGLKDYISLGNILHKPESAILDIGGMKFTKAEFKTMYEDAASSGFIRTEGGESSNFISRNITKGAEWREDFGRMAHFKHAMDEELPLALKGVNKKDALAVDKAVDQAVTQSVYRVNKFKFDFNALAPTEKQIIRRAVPFYTYTRKALPLLMEALILNPKFLDYTNQILNHFGPGPLKQQGKISQWLLDSGYKNVTSGNQPWGVTPEDYLPTQTITGAYPKNWLSMANPVIQGLAELKTGKDSFSDKKITSPIDYAADKIKGVSILQRATADTGSKWELALRELGLPVRQLTTARQASATQEKRFQLKNAIKKIDSWNTDKGYQVYLSERQDGTDIRIKKDNQVLESFTDLTSLLKWMEAHGLPIPHS